MAKAWVYKRGRDKYLVLWRDGDGKLRSRTCRTRTDADEYCDRKRAELRDGPGIVHAVWDDAAAAYLDYVRNVKGKEPETIRQYQNSLGAFRRLLGPILPASMSERAVEVFVRLRRQEDAASGTINKDLRHLKAFTRFAARKRLMPAAVLTIHWLEYRQTETKHKPRTLSVDEFRGLLRAAKELYGVPWVMRIILAVTTGMRQQDIERLMVKDISGDTLAALNRKAHKFDEGRPIHAVAAHLLERYISTLPAGQDRLWPDRYHHSKWDRIKEAAKLPGLKYHALRASCASFVMQAGYSTGVAQDMLEHSTPILTQAVYANLSPVYRDAVNSIPLAKAIEGLDLDLP